MKRKAKWRSRSTKLQAALNQALKKYGRRKYISGIDIGPKFVKGVETSQSVIRFHVIKKKGPVTHPTKRLPTSILGCKTDVIESTTRLHADPDAATEDRGQRHDPISPGLSIGRLDGKGPPGTLGFVLHDSIQDQQVILSNWHVLVGASGKKGDLIVQPSVQEQATPGDVVAEVSRFILNQKGDAAIATLNKTRGAINQQYGSNVQIVSIRRPNKGDIVEKSGRTTGVTRGVVHAQGVYFLNYGSRRIGIDGFMIRAVPSDQQGPDISAGGDSGSVWYRPQSGEAVGLHVGELSGEVESVISCYLDSVMDELGISLQ